MRVGNGGGGGGGGEVKRMLGYDGEQEKGGGEKMARFFSGVMGEEYDVGD